MCGIVGIVGQSDVAPRLLEGLKRLEYRGYDSAGIAVLSGCGVKVRRAVGKLDALRAEVGRDTPAGSVGIGHTRWATHGAATLDNAHPHTVGGVRLVHNGIIENHVELRVELQGQGVRMASKTDTEVAAAYLNSLLAKFDTLDDAFAAFLSRLTGSYALAVMFDGYPDLLFVARQGSPLAVGYGAEASEDGTSEMFIGSDALALSPFTDRVTYLEDGDWAAVRPGCVEIYDRRGQSVERDIVTISQANLSADKGNWPHFMRKEIEEQPETVAVLLGHVFDPFRYQLKPILGGVDFAGANKIVLLACGTAHYACHVASYWIEEIAGIPVEIDLASEYRYRQRPLTGREIVVAVSQSGETADTLSAFSALSGAVASRIAIVNVATSSIAREADDVLDIHAGPEIGVASTKAFTGQLMALAALALKAGQARGVLDDEQVADLMREMTTVPFVLSETLQLAPDVAAAARHLSKATDVYFLGRGAHYPIALEAALKMKEISYIHAEAYAAGELKHGPIALIDHGTPVVVFDNVCSLNEKTASNVSEVVARGADVLRIGASEGCALRIPTAGPIASVFAGTVVAQLLAYFVAVEKGTDVDQPRNLAKSVTVE